MSLLVVAIFYFLESTWVLFFIGVISIQFLAFLVDAFSDDKAITINRIIKEYLFCLSRYTHFLVPAFLCILLYLFVHLVQMTGIANLLVEFLSWHRFIEDSSANIFLIRHLIYVVLLIFILPLAYFIMINQYYSQVCKLRALDLKKRLETFGNQTQIFEH